MKIFVPGRICLFGEHTDWAGGYRRINGSLEKGRALVVGTNQGLYAEVKPHPDKLIFHARLPDGTRKGPFELPMERDALLAAAASGGFISYVAGTAYQILTHYRVQGLEIDNYLTDLPVKKGLSSSAAVCVLTARAFNRVYDLKMTVRGEMECAYSGEITTPSRCGRLDQGCAYGSRPVLMTFDGDRLDVQEQHVASPLHYVIVDLKAKKDTVKILTELNRCYPFPEDERDRGVQNYLGAASGKITVRATEALAEGNAEQLGRLMVEAQAGFDQWCAPVCPEELTAPVLHQLLNYAPIQPHILGAKGVGSQGDGTAQILVKDEDAQGRVIEIIERDLGMECMKLSIASGRHVCKAVVPAAGFGTRLFPATKGVKKEFFPVVDSSGRCKPVILCIVEELIEAGIEEVALIVQPKDKELFSDFFKQRLDIAHFNKLSKEDREYALKMDEIGPRVTILTQESQEGFGHAVYCAKDWVGHAPFLMVLGDHLYSSNQERSCARQMLDMFEETGMSVVGLKPEPAEHIAHFGCVTGDWLEEGWLNITEFAEKPTVKYAEEMLKTAHVPEGQYLTVWGQYVLTPAIFDHLEAAIENNMRCGGEFGLTGCMETLRKEEGFAGFLVDGQRFDMGRPELYYQTVTAYRNA
jgi:UTP-glucose-1-phosphate uridylyltransferase/mevalonate kinase